MSPALKKKILSREEILAASLPSTEDKRRCEECNIVFKNLGAKNMHLLRTHRISVKESEQEKINDDDSPETSTIDDSSFQCSDCEKSFASRKLLIQHFQKMHKPKNIKCNFCEKAFGLERDLRYHQTNRCKRKRLAESSSDTVTKKKKPKSDDEILRNLLAKLPPHLKIIDTSEMVTTSTQTDTVVHDAGLQVYIEQPYYNPSPDQQYSTQTEPMYTNQYQQTYTIPCPNYADWRHSETQTQNPTNTIGTATPYWHGNESGTQTWYPSDEPQMIDSYSMTDELNYMN